MSETEGSPVAPQSEIGVNLLKDMGFRGIDGIGVDDFFDDKSPVKIQSHIGLGAFGMPPTLLSASNLRGLPEGASTSVRGDIHNGVDQALRETFNAGVTEIEDRRYEEPFLNFAAEAAYAGNTETLRAALEQMEEGPVTRTLRVIDNMAQVRLVQAEIAELQMKANESIKSPVQQAVLEHRMVDHVKTSGVLLMQDAQPQMQELFRATQAKIDALKAGNQ